MADDSNDGGWVTQALGAVNSPLTYFALVTISVSVLLPKVLAATELSATQDLGVIVGAAVLILLVLIIVTYFTHQSPNKLGRRVDTVEDFVEGGLSSYVQTAVNNLVRRESLLNPPPREDE